MRAAITGVQQYSVAAYSSTLRLNCGTVKERNCGHKKQLREMDADLPALLTFAMKIAGGSGSDISERS